MKYVGRKSYVPGPKSKEPAPHGPRLVVPDDTLSIKEIIRRFVNGMDIGGNEDRGVFEEGSDFDSPDLEKLRHADIFDQQLHREAIEAERKTVVERAQKKERIASKKLKAQQDAERAELEAFKQQQKDKQKDPKSQGS